MPLPYLHEAAVIFIVAAFIILVGLPSMAVEQVYHADNRFDRVNPVQLISSTLLLCLSVFVLTAGHGIVALALVQLAAALTHLLLLTALLPATFPGVHLMLVRFSSVRLRPLIHSNKWAFLSNVGPSLFDMLIWLVLGSLAPMKEIAIFGLAGKPARQLRNLVDRGDNLALEIVIARRLWSRMSPLELVVVAVAAGVVYFLIWGLRTALPLYRSYAEAVAQ